MEKMIMERYFSIYCVLYFHFITCLTIKDSLSDINIDIYFWDDRLTFLDTNSIIAEQLESWCWIESRDLTALNALKTFDIKCDHLLEFWLIGRDINKKKWEKIMNIFWSNFF